MNTVFHFSTGGDEAQTRALNNVENLLDDVSVATGSLVVVTNADGVFLLRKDGPHRDRVAALHERGVSFRVCSNSLPGRNLDGDSLHPVAEIIPSGVGELTKLQSDGYAYIKTP